LYEHVWDDLYYGDGNTIMVHISRLREKLGDDKKEPKYIKTIKSLGYRLEP
jgi:DNA-binding response OmpR family regulator